MVTIAHRFSMPRPALPLTLTFTSLFRGTIMSGATLAVFSIFSVGIISPDYEHLANQILAYISKVDNAK